MGVERSNASRRGRAVLVLVAAALLLSGCGPGYLDAGKKVPATDENREIYNVLVAYHRAIEDRDVEALRKLISKRYYENGGTTDTDKDDYGIDKLGADVLPKLRENVKRVQFRIKLLHIEVDGENAVAQYEYFGRALLTEGGRESYKMWNDFAQMKLLREDGAWKIAEGL
ncbi:MAG: nuclear transport factor 2 family protein [Deltaproteobacteria bacterium]|nr:nuclear transport factor 2 family protein [Deltaproteobacteria bacterium]